MSAASSSRVISSVTWSAMSPECVIPAAASASSRRAAELSDRTLSTAERQEIQQRLAQRGFYQGEIDGLFGSATMESVSAFQRSIGVTPDGYPTSILLDQLRR